jgi:hypothetical protein
MVGGLAAEISVVAIICHWVIMTKKANKQYQNRCVYIFLSFTRF